MGLFGKKKDATTATVTVPARPGWLAECSHLCGFRVQVNDKKETANILQFHMKNSHKTNVSEADAAAGLKSITL